MYKPIPTIEELGIEEFITFEEEKRFKKLEEKVDKRFHPYSKKIHSEDEEFKLLNGILFLLFVIPSSFAIILGMPMNTFYYFIIVWVHEAGHGFFSLFGPRTLVALAGFMMEMAVTLVPGMYFLKFRRGYLAAFVFLMCAGLSMSFNGVYMQSALNPTGTSFAGALTGRHNDMSLDNHDWTQIFREFGVLKISREIGLFFQQLGHTMAILFFINSYLYLALLISGSKIVLKKLVSSGACITFFMLIISQAPFFEVLISLLLAVPQLVIGTKIIILGVQKHF